MYGCKTEEQIFQEIVSNLAVAIGTIILAIIAIWGHWIQMRILAPKLHVALKKEETRTI